MDPNLLKMSASILFLRDKKIPPWRGLPGGGTCMSGENVYLWGLADKTFQESFIDRHRTKAGKILNDIGEALTGRGEKSGNWKTWVFWYVPNWTRIGKNAGISTKDGGRVFLLGTADEVRGRLVRDLHKIGAGDPWAQNRAEAWSAVVGISTTIAGIILTCIPVTAAAGPAVIAGGAALSALIAASGDGVSLAELSAATSGMAEAALSAVEDADTKTTDLRSAFEGAEALEKMLEPPKPGKKQGKIGKIKPTPAAKPDAGDNATTTTTKTGSKGALAVLALGSLLAAALGG